MSAGTSGAGTNGEETSGAGTSDAETGDHPIPGTGPRIVLALEGAMTLSTASGTHELSAGRAVFIPAADGPLTARGEGRFAQASVP